MDIRSVDLNLLGVLDALVRARSVSRAAEALGMSQPAVSYALARLRTLLGDPLFIRTAHGLRPTPRAETLAPALEAIIDRIKAEILQPPPFDPATSRRAFKFNMADVGEMVFLPAIRARVAQLAPFADIRTISAAPAQLEEALASGEVDLALGYFPALRGSAFFHQRLFSHSFVCIVRKDHPRIGNQITKKQFLEESHAVVRQEGKSHEVFEQALLDQGLARRIALSVPHFLAIPLIIAESDLVVTVPYAVARSFARMTALKLLRPPIPVRQADVMQHWHARFHHDAANRWLRGIVSSLFLAASRRAARPANRGRPMNP